MNKTKCFQGKTEGFHFYWSGGCFLSSIGLTGLWLLFSVVVVVVVVVVAAVVVVVVVVVVAGGGDGAVAAVVGVFLERNRTL